MLIHERFSILYKKILSIILIFPYINQSNIPKHYEIGLNLPIRENPDDINDQRPLDVPDWDLFELGQFFHIVLLSLEKIQDYFDNLDYINYSVDARVINEIEVLSYLKFVIGHH